MTQDRGPSLVEAAPWIAKFQGAILVVKLGGELLVRDSVLERVVPQIVTMYQCGLRPVLVHGGGIQVDQACAARGIEIQKIGGRRVTTPEAMEVLAEVIAELNRGIVERLAAKQVRARGMASGVHEGIRCSRRGPTVFPDGVTVDWGMVGDVQGVEVDRILEPSESWVVPVLPSLGVGEDAALLNVNADTIAARVAISLGAQKLVFLTYVRGVMLDMSDAGPVSFVVPDQAKRMIDEEVVKGGMKAKLEECLRALEGGVQSVHIISGTEPYTLLRETFTDEGCGTQISAEAI